jgi:hypothetical protein
MQLLPRVVSLHDIGDVEMFIQAQLNEWRTNAGHVLTVDEREELAAESLCILYELAARFEPHREGYAQAGRFSGFAAAYLPKKLGDAWHRRNPGHRYITDAATGKRRWQFFLEAVSLDGIRDDLDARTGGAHVADEPFLGADKWVPVAPLERLAA